MQISSTGEKHGDEVDVDLRRFPYVGLGDRASRDEHAGDRRRLLADGEIERNDQPEMNGIDAHSGSSGMTIGTTRMIAAEEWRKKPSIEKQDIEDQQDKILVVR